MTKTISAASTTASKVAIQRLLDGAEQRVEGVTAAHLGTQHPELFLAVGHVRLPAVQSLPPAGLFDPVQRFSVRDSLIPPSCLDAA
jgi:hypothetical protein